MSVTVAVVEPGRLLSRRFESVLSGLGAEIWREGDDGSPDIVFYDSDGPDAQRDRVSERWAGVAVRVAMRASESSLVDDGAELVLHKPFDAATLGSALAGATERVLNAAESIGSHDAGTGAGLSDEEADVELHDILEIEDDAVFDGDEVLASEFVSLETDPVEPPTESNGPDDATQLAERIASAAELIAGQDDWSARVTAARAVLRGFRVRRET